MRRNEEVSVGLAMRRLKDVTTGLYVITAICGLIDVVCSIGLGGVFAEMMTGMLLMGVDRKSRRYFAVAAARPAAATSASWLAAAPAAPIAPTTLPSITIGRPPSTGVMPGSPCMRGVELPGATESCRALVGRLTLLAVTALRLAQRDLDAGELRVVGVWAPTLGLGRCSDNEIPLAEIEKWGRIRAPAPYAT
jgi:hypothetical protein